MSPADRAEWWARELRAAEQADDGSLGARARVVRAEGTLRYWEAVVGLQRERVSA